MPRDRDGTFEPVAVHERQRRLSDVDAVAISLYAKGLATGEISAHFAEVYGRRCRRTPSPGSARLGHDSSQTEHAGLWADRIRREGLRCFGLVWNG